MSVESNRSYRIMKVIIGNLDWIILWLLLVIYIEYSEVHQDLHKNDIEFNTFTLNGVEYMEFYKKGRPDEVYRVKLEE